MKYLIILCLFLSACSSIEPETIVPVKAIQTEASFDKNDQDSGIKEFIKGKGFVLSDSAVERYKKLAKQFEEEPIGLSKFEDKNILDNEGMTLFLDLNDRNLNK